MEDQKIIEELREQRALLNEHSEMLRKMQRAARWGLVFGVLRFLIIAIPFILAFIYLPPLIEEFLRDVYPQGQENLPVLPQNINVNELRGLFER